MSLPSADERNRILELFMAGVDELDRAVTEAPARWIDTRPETREWSIREIVAHCADMELMSAARCRLLIAEPDSPIVGIDPDAWAASPGYQQVAVSDSMALIRSSRSFMWQLLVQLTDHQWANVGQHSESGALSLVNWLTYFANHLHTHAEQIRNNVAILDATESVDPA